MMFFTGVAVWIKYRGKTWIKGVLAIVAFFIGYAPVSYTHLAVRYFSKSADRTTDVSDPAGRSAGHDDGRGSGYDGRRGRAHGT